MQDEVHKIYKKRSENVRIEFLIMCMIYNLKKYHLY